MKKLLALLVSLILMLGTIPVFSLTANAVSATSSQALAWVQSKLGVAIDYDGVYGAQCVDLIKAYYKYLGVTPVSGNGCDYSWNSLPTGWVRTQGGVPQPGDILIYSATSGSAYGHVAIYESDYVTYHQNYAGNKYVVKVTNVKYNGSWLSNYWGCIHPNFSSGSSSPSVTFNAWSNDNYTFINDTNAAIGQEIIVSNGTCTQTGMYLYDINSNYLAKGKNDSHTINRIFFNVNTEMGYKLAAGTTYKYKFYAIVNGITYWSSMHSFTTTGTHVHTGGKATCTAAAKCETCNTSYGNLKAHTNVLLGNYDATCTEAGLSGSTICIICGAITNKGTTVAEKGHTYYTDTTKATMSVDGSIITKCSVCSSQKSSSIIYKISSVKLAASTYSYTGKAITPAVTVKNSKGTKVVKGTDYTVSYSGGRKNVGKYKVTVTFKGNYSGSKTLYFTINPAKTTVKKLTPAKKALKVSITKKSAQVSGYQIQYSTSKSFSGAKSVKITGTSKTIKSLKAKKTYYVRVRTYKKVGSKVYYSTWSTAKKAKTK